MQYLMLNTRNETSRIIFATKMSNQTSDKKNDNHADVQYIHQTSRYNCDSSQWARSNIL